MTETEQQEVGRMFMEREAAEISLVCTKNKLGRIVTTPRGTAEAIEKRQEPPLAGDPLPTADEIDELLEKEKTLRLRADELNDFFERRRREKGL